MSRLHFAEINEALDEIKEQTQPQPGDDEYEGEEISLLREWNRKEESRSNTQRILHPHHNNITVGR